MSIRVAICLCGVVLLAFAGCDTPAARARWHQGTFGQLSAADRQLVLAGKVRPGMSTDTVCIAWGQPDAERVVNDGKALKQIWTYRRQLTLKPAMDSFDRWLPGQGVFGARLPLSLTGGFGFGGVGNEGTLLYQPHLLVTGETVKRAEFDGGRLEHYELFPPGSSAAR